MCHHCGAFRSQKETHARHFLADTRSSACYCSAQPQSAASSSYASSHGGAAAQGSAEEATGTPASTAKNKKKPAQKRKPKKSQRVVSSSSSSSSSDSEVYTDMDSDDEPIVISSQRSGKQKRGTAGTPHNAEKYAGCGRPVRNCGSYSWRVGIHSWCLHNWMLRGCAEWFRRWVKGCCHYSGSYLFLNSRECVLDGDWNDSEM